MRVILLLLAMCCAWAPVRAHAEMQVDRVATIGGDKNAIMSSAGVFMAITNTGAEDDALIAVSSRRSEDIRLVSLELGPNGIGRNRLVTSIPIPAGKTVMLTPLTSYVIMRSPGALPVGKGFPIQLTFQKAGSQSVIVKVLSQEAFGELFPPEVMAARIAELRRARANVPGNDQSWVGRLRDKIRQVGRKASGLPDDSSSFRETGRNGQHPAVTNLPLGPVDPKIAAQLRAQRQAEAEAKAARSTLPQYREPDPSAMKPGPLPSVDGTRPVPQGPSTPIPSDAAR